MQEINGNYGLWKEVLPPLSGLGIHLALDFEVQGEEALSRLMLVVSPP